MHRGKRFKADYALDLVEAQVAKQIRDFMEWRGWRRIRNNVGLATGANGDMVRFGEKGMADTQFIHYVSDEKAKEWGIPRALALVIWVETKKPGADMSCRCKPGLDKLCRPCSQLKWRNAERARGAIVIVADNLERFEKWYQENFSWLHASGTGSGQLRLIE